MPKSLSNREALEKALLDIATEYLAKPSGLLIDFEEFLYEQGISSKKLRKEQRETTSYSAGDTPKWKLLGFKNEKELKEFEARADFPGWDAL